MEVHFSPDVEARLLQVASASGKPVEELVQDSVHHMLESRSRYVAGVERGLDQANRGDLVEHQAVLDRIGRLLQL